MQRLESLLVKYGFIKENLIYGDGKEILKNSVQKQSLCFLSWFLSGKGPDFEEVR